LIIGVPDQFPSLEPACTPARLRGNILGTLARATKPADCLLNMRRLNAGVRPSAGSGFAAALLWVPEVGLSPVTCGDRRPGTITDVSPRLLYLIFSRLLAWLAQLYRPSSYADIATPGSTP
jgi:hypothetical protein